MLAWAQDGLCKIGLPPKCMHTHTHTHTHTHAYTHSHISTKTFLMHDQTMYPIRTHVHVYSECFFGSMAGGAAGLRAVAGKSCSLGSIRSCLAFVAQYTFMRCAVCGCVQDVAIYTMCYFTILLSAWLRRHVDANAILLSCVDGESCKTRAKIMLYQHAPKYVYIGCTCPHIYVYMCVIHTHI